MSRALLIGLILVLTACSPSEDTVAPGAVAKVVKTAPANATTGEVPGRRKIIIAADPWCPHNCAAGDNLEGYMVEIAREAFALAKLDIEYVNMSWARALQQANDGHIDGVVGAFKGDAPDFIFPDEPSGYSQTTLYTHPDSSWTWQGVESLRHQTLLAINGYSYSPELDAYILANQDNSEQVWVISGPSPLDRAIELLEQGRSDVFPEDRRVMTWALNHQSRGVSLRVAGQFPKSPVYIAFSPINPASSELATTLSKGIFKLRDSGRLEQILARYGLSWSD
ncbi:transporter substrate-binding domain-containing protein [Marinobacter sediminum]|uniref:substrate-binding periplasmic protein n=1 Tax=Marinobacter sediminum TaxID=256323 RepID=UPI00202EEFED|nr:transporter substrate-binding domain-containing protein [Marinobacter sediminum]MCM0613471.1 transporter substrate-binding domain-containing protein [Marinobacter sediminum]